jgi:hypothetical protein
MGNICGLLRKRRNLSRAGMAEGEEPETNILLVL